MRLTRHEACVKSSPPIPTGAMPTVGITYLIASYGLTLVCTCIHVCMYICKHLYNIYGLSDRWDASH